MESIGDKIISKHKAKKKQKKKSSKLKHLREHMDFNEAQLEEALLLKQKFRLSKKLKRKSREKASSLKRFQLIIDSSSSECIETLSPSKSEYHVFPTPKIDADRESNSTSSMPQVPKTEAKRCRPFSIERYFRNYCDTSFRDSFIPSNDILEELSGKLFTTVNIEESNSDIFQTNFDHREPPIENEEEHPPHLSAEIEQQTLLPLEDENDINDTAEKVLEEEYIISMEQEFQEPQSPDIPSSPEEINKVKYINLVDSKLVILSGDTKISLHGIVTVTVVYGKIEVLGYVIDKTKGKINLYSPRGTSLLYIKNLGGLENEESLTSCLNQFNVNIDKLNIFPHTSVVHCTKLNEPFMTYIEKHISQQILPKKEGDLPQCVFEPTSRESKGLLSVINTSEQWDEHIDNILPNTKMMICGGKGVGKSTFLRYAVNRLLMVFDKVCVIDLDPGQSEFTVPGCISIVMVKQPLLGPNYTHLQKTECSVLSSINVGINPKRYLNGIKLLMSKFRPPVGAPTLVNYMGFNRGIGLNIASAAICIVKPTDVLMIQSQQSKNNFKRVLCQPVIEKEAQFFLKNVNISPYNVIIMRSLTDNNDGWSLVPRQMREMCLLAYLGKMMDTSMSSILDSHIPTYEMDLSDINLVDSKGNKVSPLAFDANVVTLCSTFLDSEFIVLGWGIVRGIDLEKEVLILLTPLESYDLEEVHYLVVGNVTIPPSILMTTDDAVGLVPYIHEGDLPGQIIRRSYIPANKK